MHEARPTSVHNPAQQPFHWPHRKVVVLLRVALQRAATPPVDSCARLAPAAEGRQIGGVDDLTVDLDTTADTAFSPQRIA